MSKVKHPWNEHSFCGSRHRKPALYGLVCSCCLWNLWRTCFRVLEGFLQFDMDKRRNLQERIKTCSHCTSIHWHSCNHWTCRQVWTKQAKFLHFLLIKLFIRLQQLLLHVFQVTTFRRKINWRKKDNSSVKERCKSKKQNGRGGCTRPKWVQGTFFVMI